jgi:membrane-associated phospholipid phosphatase
MTSRTTVQDRDTLRTGFHVLKASRPRPPALLAALTVGVCVMIFIALAIAVEAQWAPGADRHAELFVHADVTGHLYGFMAALSFIGESGSIAVLAFACAVFYLRSGGRWTAAFVVACPTGAGILDTVLKDVFHRHRPHLWPHAAIINSFSFPSGHATISSAFLAGLTYVAWKLYGAPTGTLTALACGALATGIGFSRVYLGVHWPSDVLAGYAVGLAWAFLLIAVFESRQKRDGAPNVVTLQNAPKRHARPQVQ